MEIAMGREYKDKITGFGGICTGRAQYISGCSQALLTPKVKKGESTKAEWFDEQRLEIASGKVVKLDNSETPGCDIAAPIR
jgi:hypothetical protein